MFLSLYLILKVHVDPGNSRYNKEIPLETHNYLIVSSDCFGILLYFLNLQAKMDERSYKHDRLNIYMATEGAPSSAGDHVIRS